MTPGARIAAAIDILDGVVSGANAEQTLTTWGRKNRYAGSGDRAAIRDHVFTAMRCWRSYAWLGGADTGRGVMLGLVRAQGIDPETIFTGEGYAPKMLDASESTQEPLTNAPRAVQLDLPDWLIPELERSLGADLDNICETLRHRAPVFLRANRLITTRQGAIDALAKDDIDAIAHPLCATALEVTRNPRRVQNSDAYKRGLVELQDAASQAIVDMLPKAKHVLDYCAGGGGKSLALAAQGDIRIFAHDIQPDRMRDIPTRAARAGTTINVIEPGDIAAHGPYDLVFCDAPCSGSGSWRRAPQAKWQLTQDRLEELLGVQFDILNKAAGHVAPGGTLAYATCSLMKCENQDQISRFLQENPDWQLNSDHSFTPLSGGDGFYVACLSR